MENDVIWMFCENAWEDRRRIERIMSRCFILFLIGVEMPVPLSLISIKTLFFFFFVRTLSFLKFLSDGTSFTFLFFLLYFKDDEIF